MYMDRWIIKQLSKIEVVHWYIIDQKYPESDNDTDFESLDSPVHTHTNDSIGQGSIIDYLKLLQTN